MYFDQKWNCCISLRRKGNLINPDNLVEIVVVSDLCPEVKAITIAAIIITILTISNIRKCFFLCLWKFCIMNL